MRYLKIVCTPHVQYNLHSWPFKHPKWWSNSQSQVLSCIFRMFFLDVPPQNCQFEVNNSCFPYFLTKLSPAKQKKTSSETHSPIIFGPSELLRRYAQDMCSGLCGRCQGADLWEGPRSLGASLGFFSSGDIGIPSLELRPCRVSGGWKISFQSF